MNIFYWCILPTAAETAWFTFINWCLSNVRRSKWVKQVGEVTSIWSETSRNCTFCLAVLSCWCSAAAAADGDDQCDGIVWVRLQERTESVLISQMSWHSDRYWYPTDLAIVFSTYSGPCDSFFNCLRHLKRSYDDDGDDVYSRCIFWWRWCVDIAVDQRRGRAAQEGGHCRRRVWLDPAAAADPRRVGQVHPDLLSAAARRPGRQLAAVILLTLIHWLSDISLKNAVSKSHIASCYKLLLTT